MKPEETSFGAFGLIESAGFSSLMLLIEMKVTKTENLQMKRGGDMIASTKHRGSLRCKREVFIRGM